MVQQLHLEFITAIINYVIQSNVADYEGAVSHLANIANETEEWASKWINLFVDAICKINLKEFDYNFAYDWLKEQSKSLDAMHIASMLSSTIANLLLASSDEIDTVNVVLDGKVIQTITKNVQSKSSGDLIIEKKGIKWLLKDAYFSGNQLVYSQAIPLELQSLIEEKQQLESMLANMPTDEELLEWAKEHHPDMIEMKKIQDRLDEVEERIQELQNLSFEG